MSILRALRARLTRRRRARAEAQIDAAFVEAWALIAEARPSWSSSDQ